MDKIQEAYEKMVNEKNFSKMKDDKLLSWIKKNDTEESVGQVFGMQLKAAKKEKKKRGLSEDRLDEFYFDKNVYQKLKNAKRETDPQKGVAILADVIQTILFQLER